MAHQNIWVKCWNSETPLCSIPVTLVRNVCNELLQLRCHHQCRACILKPPHQGLLGSSPTRRNSLPLGLGTGAESSQTCGVSPFKASSSRRALNYLQLVSSDALILLVYYTRKLHSHNLEIAQTSYAVSRLAVQSWDWLCNLEIGTQFLDSENVQRNLKIAQIPKLRGTYAYVCMHVRSVCVCRQ